MNLLLLNLYNRTLSSSLSISRYKILQKAFINTAPRIVHKDELLSKEEQLFKKYEHCIFYSDYLEWNELKLGYRRNMIAIDKLEQEQEKKQQQKQFNPVPITLKYLGLFTTKTKEEVPEDKSDNEHILHFPYKEINASVVSTTSSRPENQDVIPAEDTKLELRTRLELLNKSNDHLQWMNDYENFPDIENVKDVVGSGPINYGTPNPKVPTSNVPCGGCGALLHCKDSSIPGYIPSEIFIQYNAPGGIKLEGIHCQRCHFLEHYDMALQVRVSPDDYPKVLHTISERKQALVILLVDLLDFPCSIWPGIADLIGYNRPIIVVGNKVDLLPDDGKGYLHRIKNNLMNSIKEAGLAMTNIKDICLISAKTGFGVEDLITRLHSIWQYKGDVYIVGCTNVGKSSLFNILLQSDYCKDSAVDLIQRATTSPWPGTTLNLLKFPILRPTGWRLYVRNKRIHSTKMLDRQENELRQKLYKTNKNSKFASVIGHIERSFKTAKPLDDENTDIYAMKMRANASNSNPIGIDMKDKRFKLNKWCYDTPGVIQPEQIIHHFTTNELMIIFPKGIIRPRTFSLQPGSSLFIGGIARIDFLKGPVSCRFTVFASNQLPITIFKTSEVEYIYNDLLRTNAFSVPICNEERLKLWPGLESSKRFTVTGLDRNSSCADLVLSSAGWVAITPDTGKKCTIQGWTPEARGIYLRDCLLPNIVRKRGKRIRDSVAYRI